MRVSKKRKEKIKSAYFLRNLRFKVSNGQLKFPIQNYSFELLKMNELVLIKN